MKFLLPTKTADTLTECLY